MNLSREDLWKIELVLRLSNHPDAKEAHAKVFSLLNNNRRINIDIHALQERAGEWVRKTFGLEILKSKDERAMRVLEEAIELAQATKVDKARVINLVHFVFDKPVGDVAQEAAGVGFTLLAWGDSMELDIATLIEEEIDRVDDHRLMEKIRKKHDSKVDAGISMKSKYYGK